MAKKQIFGTDGIRGRAGEGWLATEAVSALGRTLGQVCRETWGATSGGQNSGRVLLGHDGRRSAGSLESALARGLSTAGLQCVTAGLIPTPGLAWLGRELEYDLAVMISASHNPAEDNGIKIFTRNAEKLSDEFELQIEARLAQDPEPVAEGPTPERDPSLEGQYLSHLTDTVGNGLRLDGSSLVVDCANGGASRVAPRVFGRLGAQVWPIAAEPDGDNINADCGSTHPAMLQSQVRKLEAACGIALDGDGDRCVLVDERGELVHGDALLALLGRHAAQQKAWKDPRLVATIMSNRGLHKSLREVGIGVETVDVGDRYVVEALRREKLQLGGEQSGHIVFGADNHFIGDGIYTALRVLRVMRETGQPLSRLAAVFQAFPQVLINVPVKRKPALDEVPALMDAVRKAESELGEDGRVLLRYSGTEPLARLMVEGPDGAVIQEKAEKVARVVADELGS